jgi:hypothetical protein
MMQQIVAILIVAACGAWLSFQAYRFLRPKPGGKACAGGCCDGHEQKKAPATAAGPGTMMISSDDLRSRLAARKK